MKFGRTIALCLGSVKRFSRPLIVAKEIGKGDGYPRVATKRLGIRRGLQRSQYPQEVWLKLPVSARTRTLQNTDVNS